jgi:glyoxylase-like metal-dependent hydrolase (beta-lactamase superfamily II)
MDIAMMIWVLKGVDGRIAIVDSGFHRERYFTQFTVKDYLKPSEAIAPLGIKPEDVTDLLLSHMHWDHAGGVDLFPKGARLGAEGRVRLLHGRGLAVRTHARRHRRGRCAGDCEAEHRGQGVVRARRRRHVVVRDHVRHRRQAYLRLAVRRRLDQTARGRDRVRQHVSYENLDTHTPIAQTLDAASNLKTQDRMKSLASEPRFLVPGHDPAVFTRFPRVSDRIVRIE